MENNVVTLKANLKKWQNKAGAKTLKFYFIYSIFIICLAYLLKELANSLLLTTQKEIIDQYFNFNNGYSVYTITVTLCQAVSIFTFIFKAWADKFGRKPMLIISTFGLALGMFICFIANNSLPVFIIGMVIMYFFIPADIQVVYVLETASDKHRSFWLALYKAIGVMGISLISLFTTWFSGTQWHNMFIIPACIGIVCGLLCLFFLKESDLFIQNKIEYYNNEIIKAKKHNSSKSIVEEDKKDKTKNAQGGIIAAVKYMFLEKKLLWLFLVGVIFSLCTVGIANFRIILEKAYQSGISDASFNTIFIVYPFAYALVELFIGILADMLGRKAAIFIGGFATLFGFLTFIIGVNSTWQSALIGVELGVFFGGYYASIDCFNVICAEQSPTNLRSSLLSILGVSLSIGSFIATGLLLMFENIIQQMDKGFFGLILIVPSLFAGLIILLLKIPETKKVELHKYFSIRKALHMKEPVNSKPKAVHRPIIRLTKEEDIPKVMEIFNQARIYMKDNGNPDQWGDTWPAEWIIREDIQNNYSYVVTINEKVVATFALIIGIDKTYKVIKQGKWLSDEPYLTIHRLASSGDKVGIFPIIVKWCEKFNLNMRIDTHENNKAMIHQAEKCGFVYCGHITPIEGGDRLAYERLREKK